jgi:hypothetical protein
MLLAPLFEAEISAKAVLSSRWPEKLEKPDVNWRIEREHPTYHDRPVRAGIIAGLDP